MIHKKLFNLIIENIDFEKLRIDKKTSFTIWINDITFQLKDNSIIGQLNGIGTITYYEKNNYGDYVIKLWNIIDSLIIFYYMELDVVNRNDNEVMELRND